MAAWSVAETNETECKYSQMQIIHY